MYNQYYPQYPPQFQMNDMQQYRQQIQQPQMQPAQMSFANQDDRIWVQGEEAAKAYLVAPNSFVRLWDSTQSVFYEKRADATGKPSMIVYEYHSNAQCQNTDENTESINKYTEQIKALYERINELEERMSEYEQAESYDDDTAVPAVPERVQRKSAGGSRKASARG